MLNVSRSAVQQAKKVIDSGNDEVIEAVRSGEMSINAAVKVVKPVSPPDAPLNQFEVVDKQVQALMSAWNKAGSASRIKRQIYRLKNLRYHSRTVP